MKFNKQKVRSHCKSITLISTALCALFLQGCSSKLKESSLASYNAAILNPITLDSLPNNGGIMAVQCASFTSEWICYAFPMSEALFGNTDTLIKPSSFSNGDLTSQFQLSSDSVLTQVKTVIFDNEGLTANECTARVSFKESEEENNFMQINIGDKIWSIDQQEASNCRTTIVTYPLNQTKSTEE